jgi:calcium/calmodulin-dependent protein kinase I
MGLCASQQRSITSQNPSESAPRRSSHVENLHPVNPDIKVHTVVSAELDCDHESSMMIPLGECSDEQLLAEVARRHLDLHDKITDTLVRETYDIGRVIGHGASGQVFKVKHKTNNKSFACKVVKKNANMNDAQSMSTEIEIMKRIRHRHIVSMYELYETPKCLWIILELVDGGDIHHFLANMTNYTEMMAARHFKQILLGVHYLHTLGVVHRDLKLDNILLHGSGSNADLKIADFGLSALVRINEDGYDAEESGKRKMYSHLKEMWGTKEYFAPEVIEQAYGPQADVWALGCVLFEMLSGDQCFPVKEKDTEAKFYSRIQKGDYTFNGAAWIHISPEGKDLVSKLLVVDPTKRLSATEALKHPWITGEAHSDMHDRHLEESTKRHAERLEEKRKKENRKR